ncbi:MAG: penicillin-binding protein 2 [Verrucomicrobiota bacterium]
MGSSGRRFFFQTTTAHSLVAVVVLLPLTRISAQTPQTPESAPENKPAAASSAPVYTPTLETQRQARTWSFAIPPPRGLICDRNGLPLVNQRVGTNLALIFPRPFDFTEAQVTAFVQEEAREISRVLGRNIQARPDAALKHYRNRPHLSWVLIENLSESDLQKVNAQKRDSWDLLAFYARNYPNGTLAGHLLGYIGRTGRFLDSPVENGEPLWPDTEGRDGLEKSFDNVLRGEPGQLNVIYNGAAKKASEQVTLNPIPGKHVVTTLDIELQKLCEQALAAKAKRGALVFIDPHNGDILAMASWPPINPNKFVPTIREADFKALNEDPNGPLIARTFRSTYTPGSTFKCFVGLAGLASGKITPNDEFDCPPAMEIGDHVFHNWKKEGTGSLNFAQALEQSCNTWFYQAGLKMGGQVIVDYALQLGLGEKTGIPLPDEKGGRIPTEEYLRKKGLRLAGGSVANLSIGQGDTEISPLQMAQAMSVIANGGLLYQARLVQQIQDVTGEVANAYPVRIRRKIEIPTETMGALRQGMTLVVNGSRGTAGSARLDKITVAGKTGTAQWGAKPNERTAAWFAGFAPAEGPRVAFAALYEGDANNHDVHGGTNAAPMIGMVLKEYFKDPSKAKAVKPKDEDGKEIDLPMTPTVVPKAAPVEPPQEKEAPPPPPKPSFWKRLFGKPS